MTITPSDSLDLLIARGPPDAADFAKQIAGIPGAYYAGLDEAYKRRNQDAFVNGLPTTIGPDGKPTLDTNSAYNTIARLGGTEKALPVIQSINQQAADANISSIQTGGGGNYFPNAPRSTIPGAPPSTAPTSSAPVRIPSDGTGQSITGIVTSSGLTGTAADNLGKALSARYKVDQTQQLSPEQFAQIQQFAGQVAGVRQQQPPQQPQPQPQQQQPQQPPPQQPPAAVPAGRPLQDETAGGLVPQAWVARGGTAETYRNLQAVISSANSSASPGAKAVAMERMKAIDGYLAENAKLTEPEKELRSSGRPGEDIPAYKARTAGGEENAKKFAAIPAEVFDTARKGNEAAQAAKYRLDLIDHSILELGPKWMGSAAGTRFEIVKGINTALDNILPKDLADTVKFDPKKIANVEDFNKQTQTLGFELAKTLGSREAMQIVQQATNSVPNFNQSPLGAKLVSGSLRQASQRQEDFYKYMVKPENRERLGAEIDFNKQNPPEMYSTRAIAASGIPLKLNPGDEKKVGYLLPGTKYMWNGKPWTKN